MTMYHILFDLRRNFTEIIKKKVFIQLSSYTLF